MFDRQRGGVRFGPTKSGLARASEGSGQRNAQPYFYWFRVGIY